MIKEGLLYRFVKISWLNKAGIAYLAKAGALIAFMSGTTMGNENLNDLQIKCIRERLESTEVVLSEINRLADLAYMSLSEGDLSQCQENIGQLICSLSEHSYEELH